METIITTLTLFGVIGHLIQNNWEWIKELFKKDSPSPQRTITQRDVYANFNQAGSGTINATGNKFFSGEKYVRMGNEGRIAICNFHLKMIRDDNIRLIDLVNRSICITREDEDQVVISKQIFLKKAERQRESIEQFQSIFEEE